MIFGPDDNLYVSSLDTGQILRYDGTDGKFLDIFVDRNIGELNSPKGLTFGMHGDLFVSNDADNSVLRYSQNGMSKGPFVEENTLEFIAETPIILNATNQINQKNNTGFESVPVIPPRGLLDPEGVTFFPNCYNTSSQIKNPNSDQFKTNEECYFLVSSSKNNLIFRYVYNENTESTFKDVFVNDELIKNPQTVIFGPDNNLYVASFDTDEVLRFDGSTGEFIDVFASSGGLNGPVGMVFDDVTSSLFVTSKNSDQVFKYDSKTGEFLEIFIQDTDDDAQKPESIIRGPDNNLYVSSSKTNQILQYDLDGNLIEKFVTDKSGGLYQPKDLGFNQEGNLCVGSLVSNDIKCYDAQNGKILEKIDVSFNRGLMGKPYSEFGPDGELYVSEALSSTVSRYDRNTNLFSAKILSGEEEPLLGPRNFVFGPDDNLYVTSNNNHQILRLDGDTGIFTDVFITHSSGGLAAPQDLAFHDEHLYVTSNDNHRVLRYSQTTGEFVDDFVKSRDGGLSEPRGLIFDNDGHLYIASNENHKILRYDAITGAFEKEIDTGGSLLNPVGLIFDNTGNLIVSSSGNDQVLSYDISSPLLEPRILISAEFIDDPADLAIDSENDLLYVASSKSNRVLKYDFKSEDIQEIKEITDTAMLEIPHGLLLQNDELFISNIQSNRILKHDLNTRESELFYSGTLGVLGPLGLTFGPDGSMYVISGRNHDIFRYDPSNGNLLGTFSLSPFQDTNDESVLPYGQLQDLVFSPDGRHLYVTSMFTHQVLRFDSLTGEYLDVFIDLNKYGLKYPQNIVYSPNRESIFINSFDTGSIFVFDAKTGELVEKLDAKTRLNIKNMKFGFDGKLYFTVDDYSRVLYHEPNSGAIAEFDLGGIYLGNLDLNLLKKKYLLNNINTTRHDTIVVYDNLLERQFATISLSDDLVGDFLPLPVIWNMIIGNIGNVEEPYSNQKK